MNFTTKSVFAILSLTSALALSACSKTAPGEEFVGNWQSPTKASEHIQIDRNGEGFMIRDIGQSQFDGKPSETKVPATYKDGVLQVATGMGILNFGHDAKNDTLTVPTMGGSADFSRIK
jgi:hypothetical protein